VTSDGEPDIPQNLLDANSIVSFHWVLFRPVKVSERSFFKMPMHGFQNPVIRGVEISAARIRKRGIDVALRSGFARMLQSEGFIGSV
jgi:hypothetical protein